jgi:hypothetical protein
MIQQQQTTLRGGFFLFANFFLDTPHNLEPPLM